MRDEFAYTSASKAFSALVLSTSEANEGREPRERPKRPGASLRRGPKPTRPEPSRGWTAERSEEPRRFTAGERERKEGVNQDGGPAKCQPVDAVEGGADVERVRVSEVVVATQRGGAIDLDGET